MHQVPASLSLFGWSKKINGETSLLEHLVYEIRTIRIIRVSSSNFPSHLEHG